MDGKIIDENESGVGVDIVDNNDNLHEISIEKDSWKIVYHNSDKYSDDPAKRTKAGNEHINQARRFAKYWVYHQRGYDTLDGWQNPDRITLAATALMALDEPIAESYLDDLNQQLQSLYSNIDPAVEIPDSVDPTSAVYLYDLYLGMDDEDISAYADLVSDLSVDELTDLSDAERNSLPSHNEGLFIESTAGPHIKWDTTGDGQYRTAWADQPVDRDPDARIELLAFEPDSVVELKRQAVRNLLCQVRDCYLTMGIAPPEQFRLLGHGQHDASTWYVHNELYEAYYDPDAEVDTWFEEHTPEDAYEHASETEAIDPTH